MKKRILLIIVVACFAVFGIFFFKPFIQQAKTTYRYDLKINKSDPARLNKLKSYVQRHAEEFDSLVINIGDESYYQYGPVEQSIFSASIRKSILSLLIGIAVSKDLIDIDKTLQDLNIDEPDSPLTPTEKTATIRDLMTSRSGVYIEAGGETGKMKKERPKRGSHKPGEYFYYNNWGFNALGHIFEQETKITIRKALEDWLAVPLGMQDFDPSHVIYSDDGEQSRYPAWWIYMSSRDLAKIGSLLVNGGKWKGQTIVPEKWMEESTGKYSKSKYSYLEYYGYMWWIDGKTGVYAAAGVGGQTLIIDEKNNFSITIRQDIGSSFASATWGNIFGQEIPGKTMFSIYNIMLNKEPFPDS